MVIYFWLDPKVSKSQDFLKNGSLLLYNLSATMGSLRQAQSFMVLLRLSYDKKTFFQKVGKGVLRFNMHILTEALALQEIDTKQGGNYSVGMRKLFASEP